MSTLACRPGRTVAHYEVIVANGACWPLAAFIASREAALGLPNCGDRARAELAAVAVVLDLLTVREEVAA